MKSNTPINGLSHIASSSGTADGDSFALVNLRKKNGSFQTVTAGKVIASLTDDYDVVYIHSTNFVENWIGIKGGILFTDIRSEPVMVCELDTVIRQVQGIGNTLSLLTDTGIYYLIYKNKVYRNLGFKPPFPYCKLRCTTSLVTSYFSEIGGTITDVQQAMEAMLIKNRWRDENAYLLCGCYVVRYALRLYDNSYILHSAPIFLYPLITNPYTSVLAYDGDRFLADKSSASARVYYVKADFDLSMLKDWSDIVTGVDVFISQELGAVSEDFRKIEDAITSINPPVHGIPYTRKNVSPLVTDVQKVIEQVEQVDNFYLICSLPNDGVVSMNFPTKSIGTMQNIVHQPTLGIDNFSHHFVTASCSYMYNQRLHIANINTYFFKGFDFRGITPDNPSLNIRPETFMLLVDRPDPERPEPATGKTAERAYIQVFLNTGNDDAYVISRVEDVKYIRINALFGYPDPRAYKAVITLTDRNDVMREQVTLALKIHPGLNVAYYLDASLKEITLLATEARRFEYADEVHQVNEENKIKVSGLQNPFVFENENTYVAGNGTITGMAANSCPVSEGQFGQFPLYVFSDKGIYIFEVGTGSMVYSNIAPVSDEIALPGSIQPVTGAVFFLTPRGAFCISGSSPTPLSALINADGIEQNMEHWSEIEGVVFPEQGLPEIEPFLAFIRSGGITIHFNYLENEVILSGDGYAYVYNFNSQSWHTTTHTFHPVGNCFPHLYGIVDRQVLNVSDEVVSPAPVILMSRPLKFGSQEFKSMHRMMLRGYLNNPGTLGLFTFSGNDAINFRLKTNQRIVPGKHRDVDTGLISLNKYRYFAFLLIGFLDKDSRIDFVSSTVYPVYGNDKNR